MAVSVHFTLLYILLLKNVISVMWRRVKGVFFYDFMEHYFGGRVSPKWFLFRWFVAKHVMNMCCIVVCGQKQESGRFIGSINVSECIEFVLWMDGEPLEHINKIVQAELYSRHLGPCAFLCKLWRESKKGGERKVTSISSQCSQ